MEESSDDDEKAEKIYRKCISWVLDWNFYMKLEVTIFKILKKDKIIEESSIKENEE